MKQFFKYMFASMLGTFLSFLLIFIFFLVLIVGVVSMAGKDKDQTITENTLLFLNLNTNIAERGNDNPFDSFDPIGFSSSSATGLNDILAAIDKAATDDNIKGIFMELSGVGGGFATAQEIRDALLKFKESGKFIIAYGEMISQKAYYLGSVADKIYLYPEGYLEFAGLSSETMFFKGLLQKLDIDVQVIKVGTFKSAVEPFVLDKMSEPNKQQVAGFLNSMNETILQNISASRGISRDSLFIIANELKIETAEDALNYRFVDALKFKDELLIELKDSTGVAHKDDLKTITVKSYKNVKSTKSTDKPTRDRVAVVYAYGEIIDGDASEGTIGSTTIAKELRKVRLDENIKAVVFRINSPGGSALASDVILREVELIKSVKPIVVSMGDYAASGGYYIACKADSIFAQPNTLTGSIGVFGLVPNLQSFYKNKLGITFDGVKTGQFSDLGNLNRPLSNAEKVFAQRAVDKIYDDFISHVATGRMMSKAAVDSIGQGRVWTGATALGLGLVDRIGGLNDAIATASRMAKLENYRIIEYPTQKDKFEKIFEDIFGNARTWITMKELGDEYKIYQEIKKIKNLNGIQARMEFEIDIN